MLEGDFRIILRHFFHNASPETGRIQHVGFIHAGDFLPTLHSDIETSPGNPADLGLAVGQGINGFFHTVFLDGLSLTEVKAAGELSHNHQIKTVADNLIS